MSHVIEKGCLVRDAQTCHRGHVPRWRVSEAEDFIGIWWGLYLLALPNSNLCGSHKRKFGLRRLPLFSVCSFAKNHSQCASEFGILSKFGFVICDSVGTHQRAIQRFMYLIWWPSIWIEWSILWCHRFIQLLLQPYSDINGTWLQTCRHFVQL